MKSEDKKYDVVIIGGGASGTALLYTLATYTNISKIALIEKYSEIGMVNSNAINNSQTLHTGDIDTHYSIDKARQVKPASFMVAQYISKLPKEEQGLMMKRMQKMVLAVGKDEVAQLNARYEEIRELFPALVKLDREGIAHVEPEVMRGRNPKEAVLALFDPEGFAINYGLLSRSFVAKAKANTDKTIDVLMEHLVTFIEKVDTGYMVHTKDAVIFGTVVIVDTDAYSLGFAKSLGYGKEFSLIPIAGSFYFTPEVLRGKVYRVQDARMPFSAAHGDPDLTIPNMTRFGPTARFFPVLESRNLGTMRDYFVSSGLEQMRTWFAFFTILLEPVRFTYLVKNLLYELPYVGKFFFASQIRKIVPLVKRTDVGRAHGFGGMRLQRVNINTRELLLGEGKIIGENVIFNMTPSPGASVCLYNARRDTEQIISFFHAAFIFNKKQMDQDLLITALPKNDDVSANGYSS